MATPAQITTYIAALETFLATNLGITSVSSPDGRSLSIDRAQALEELRYWQTQLAASSSNYKFGVSRFGLKGDA